MCCCHSRRHSLSIHVVSCFIQWVPSQCHHILGKLRRVGLSPSQALPETFEA